ncbi:glycoside hydrolase domain-containing protein [Rhizosphaericola mali]|uniref:Glycoside hydrolase 123-like N-terminal domain-containing protein n=1 Tax=Rhizosphaericola mali TaxID=2545455 RepID=A0A5P2G528_9BACT|nr:glycoside hydrolase domain-containing protein [Rhizosphaericola mali]QES90625.1 hypothetical protein E0W69_018840 [Rhizosphaericola mali]
MRKIHFSIIIFFVFLSIQNLHSQNLKNTIAFKEWNYDSLGNHRIVVSVPKAGKVARVTIEWRRRDENPELKSIFVVDALTNKRIINTKVEFIDREKGTILFEPVSGKGTYYIYYMPFYRQGSPFYPKDKYYNDENIASDTWLNVFKQSSAVVAIAQRNESVNEFNSFDPMEIVATKSEVNEFLKLNKNQEYFVFSEDRMHPIRMTKDFPYRWMHKNIQSPYFEGTTDKGENYSFQLGLYSDKDSLADVVLEWSDLKYKTNTIKKSYLSILNNYGNSWLGDTMNFKVQIPINKVQAFWCLVNIPDNASAGAYSGTITIHSKGLKDRIVPIKINISNKLAKNHGVDEPWKQTRLTWLNSKMAEKNALIPPYTALKLNNNEIELLGRKVAIDKTGFPKSIQTFFTEEMTAVDTQARNIITEPIHFHIKDSKSKDLAFTQSPINYSENTDTKISWNVLNTNKSLQLAVNGSLEFDGFLNYEVKLIATEDIQLKEVQLHLPITPDVAKYFMGLGEKGQAFNHDINWKWDVAHKNQDGAWIGDVNAGLQFGLRDENYSRPLNTNFYLQKPLLLPTSWGNDGAGGIDVSLKGTSMLVNCYSGERRLKKGDTLYYNFRLLVTPFHTINTEFQWDNRFVHKYLPVKKAKDYCATVINIHQGTPINPYINYPFIKTKEMKAYIDSAHALGMKVKIYNTVRELSNRAYELPALFSLGHEIYSNGKGGGYAWLQEHLDSNYIAAWYTPETNDAAIINSGMSRWHNYYVEGMNWLTKNIGIDGIYLDDVAFDRNTMKRIKKVMTDDGHPGIIDLHSANQYNKSDGFINSANLYLELFPYINRLWFGEYFDYDNNSPDFFLTEVSGIPFGLMGEMLQNNGNLYRGLLYGMTNRLFWDGGENVPADPRPIWKEWNHFGIKGSKMIGYWVKNNPIKTDNNKILATIYKKDKKVLIAIASWADGEQNFHLNFDWKKLGMDPSKCQLIAPEIENFQTKKTFNLNATIPVQNKKGWLLELVESN